MFGMTCGSIPWAVCLAAALRHKTSWLKDGDCNGVSGER
jgi:hypothetical protein